jgi:SET domain-containing protein
MKTKRQQVTPRAKVPGCVKLARSGVHGYGLFARDFIAKGAKIIEYVGERITKAESYRREQHRLAEKAAGRDGCVYIFDMTKSYDIDGDVTWNLARRINHSCGPNCEIEKYRGHLWVLAKRDIAPGEELTYDYGFDFCDFREHPCRCGAKECVGYIVNTGQRWRVRKIVAAEKATRARAKR